MSSMPKLKKVDDKKAKEDTRLMDAKKRIAQTNRRRERGEEDMDR